MSDLIGFSIFEAQEENLKRDLKPGLIYMITAPNGKVYIGQTTKTFAARMAGHKSSAKTGKGYCRHLNNAIKQYGWDKFTKEILLRCNARDLCYYEKQFIALYDALNRDHGYNLVDGGNENKTYSLEMREYMSDKIRKFKDYDLPMGVRQMKDDKQKRYGFRVKLDQYSKSYNFCMPWLSMDQKLELAMECYNTLKAKENYDHADHIGKHVKHSKPIKVPKLKISRKNQTFEKYDISKQTVKFANTVVHSYVNCTQNSYSVITEYFK
ncbi:GIY-YIG catalytic domain-containing protein [Faustovirus]|nr:GIY-YIG catalytic domain-containing protein [Faustovirus]